MANVELVLGFLEAKCDAYEMQIRVTQHHHDIKELVVTVRQEKGKKVKLVRKILAILTTFMMAFTVSGTAFADPDYSISINNAKEGETYTAYKMFDLSVDDAEDPTAFRYTVNDAWKAFSQTDEFRAVYVVDANGYVTSEEDSESGWVAGSALSTLAEKAAEYAKAKVEANKMDVAGSITIEEGTTGIINLSEPGYYVISSTLGTRAMIDTTPTNPAAEVNEKNEGDTIEKEVKEDSTGVFGPQNDAQVGDTVEFKSVVTVAARSVNVKVHDTMDEGLTLDPDSIMVYKDAEMTSEYTEAIIRTGADADTGEDASGKAFTDDFTIDIPDTFAANAVASQKLYIYYEAVLNKNAVITNDNRTVITDQINDTVVSFGQDSWSEWDSTKTTTYKFNVYKHAGNATENLAGAVFQLLNADEKVVKLVMIDNKNYRTATPEDDDDDVVETFTTVQDGDIVIWGVDADTYYLYETNAPDGYNKPTEYFEVEINSGTDIRREIVNNTGTELPSTGGIGTTIFYIVGGVMVAGAVVFLLTKRRMVGKE